MHETVPQNTNPKPKQSESKGHRLCGCGQAPGCVVSEPDTHLIPLQQRRWASGKMTAGKMGDGASGVH